MDRAGSMEEIRAIAAPGVHEAALALLPPPPATVLDIGAGPGALSQRLLKGGYTVRACDVDPGQFRVAGITCDPVDATARLPYDDGTFDAVALVEVVEHLEHPLRAVQEAVRVAKTGGVIVVTTPNIQSFLARSHFLLRGNYGRWYPDEDFLGEDPRPGFNHIMPLHPLAVRRLIRKSGAVVEEVRANDLLEVRAMNSMFSLVGKAVEVFLVPFMRPRDRLLLQGDILVFRARKVSGAAL